MPLRNLHLDDADRIRAIFYLVVVPVLVALVLLLVILNNRQQNDRAFRQSQVNAQNIHRLNDALEETCHASTIALGVITTMIFYLQSGPDPDGYRSRKAIDALVGYGGDIGQFPACRRIERP